LRILLHNIGTALSDHGIQINREMPAVVSEQLNAFY
jgi:hypothetical protein